MNILFVHDNFPAQFGALGGYLETKGWSVRYATAWEHAPKSSSRFLKYTPHRSVTEGVHPYARNFEKAAINGQASARAMMEAREQGYIPDIIVTHSGWGSGMFARDIWPEAKFVCYLEWWYQYPAPDTVSLGVYEDNLQNRLTQRTRNIAIAMDIAGADLCLCPTEFQASQFPADLCDRLTVLHDGIDIEMHKPSTIPIDNVAKLDVATMPEVVTFVTRGMEPHRGFPQFMRALATLQSRRPGLHAIIGGRDRVAYGRKLPDGESWKTKMLAELEGRLDLSRVHFISLQPRNEYVRVLQATNVHVYLTADFVLSWSLLDSMAVGCPLVVSDCPPVREYMSEDTGLLVGLHDEFALADKIEEALDNPVDMKAKGAAARQVIIDRCEAQSIFARKDRMLRELIGA
jgi:glycosyltransferase involved in cell wall biosynthesis